MKKVICVLNKALVKLGSVSPAEWRPLSESLHCEEASPQGEVYPTFHNSNCDNNNILHPDFGQQNIGNNV